TPGSPSAWGWSAPSCCATASPTCTTSSRGTCASPASSAPPERGTDMPYVPLGWLAEHAEVPAGTTAAHLAAALVRLGLEPDQLLPPAVTGPLVVGRVLSNESETNRNGKTIRYCRVDVGEHNDPPGQGKEPADVPSRGIVCGAHNFAVGDD